MTLTAFHITERLIRIVRASRDTESVFPVFTDKIQFLPCTPGLPQRMRSREKRRNMPLLAVIGAILLS